MGMRSSTGSDIRGRQSRVVLFVLALLLPLALVACAPAASAASKVADTAGWDLCVAAVQQQANLASAGAPAYNASAVTAISGGEVDMLYYAQPSIYYRCELSPATGGAWKVVSVKMLDPNELLLWGAKR
jgi:hypothetical protein